MQDVNPTRLAWDLGRRQNTERYEGYWQEKKFTLIPPELFKTDKPIWLEIGAGSGGFFTEMAHSNPGTQFIAVERDKERGNTLVRKAKRLGLPNFAGFRGNAIPAVITGIPDATLDRVFILYPCPWPRMSQRKNRWYLHPIMRHLVRVLKPGGVLVWASDQKFYIDEANWVCAHRHPLETLAVGEISPNPWNGFEYFPEGRTKFEKTFLQAGQPCYELVCRRTETRMSLESEACPKPL